jgi:hypothetical protein
VRVGNSQAKILIGTTWEERRQFLISARFTLTQDHPLKLRIDAILGPEKWSQILNGANDALDAEVREITAAAWEITESQREAAGQRLVRITEAYRRTAKQRMEDHLTQVPIAMEELGALNSLFEEAYKSNPELSACVFIESVPATYTAGDLEFRQLAERAAGSWESWLDIVVGYLLEEDHKNEYIEKQLAATASGIHKDAEPKVGEHYIVHRLLKASALCCSWLKGHQELQNRAAAAGHYRRKPLVQRRGYRPEIRQWMDKRNLRTNAQAARELRVSVSLLKSSCPQKARSAIAMRP